MKYIGEFKDINDIDYEVIIDNHNMDDITEEIVIANKGIVIDYASDGDVFKPVKMSGMTVEVVTDKLLDVFYPGYKVSVTLNRLDKGVDTCIWYGFVTPNIYSQTQYKLDTLAIECVDILSALQDYTYQIPIGERQMRSIRDMVMKCVNQLPYVEDINLIIHTELENLTFDNILLSDTNWYDEDNNPENCEDVMDNIMQFFCSEMFVIGKDIIIKPIAKHFTFDDIDNYVMSDYVNLSMLEMYNKIIVKSSIYAPEYINSWDDDAYVIDLADYRVRQASGYKCYYNLYNNIDESITIYGEQILPPDYYTSTTKRYCVFTNGKTLGEKSPAPIIKDYERMLSFRGGYNRILPSETIRLIKLDKNLGCAIGDGILCVNVEVMLSEYDLPVASDYYTPRRVTTDYKKLKMSISIGDKYWDASKNKWVDNTVNNLFKLEYEDGKDTNIWQLPVTNAKDYIGEYKEAFGICIPILDQVLVGDVKIQIYASPTDGIVTYWQHFRDLKVDFYRKDIRNDYLGRKRLTVKELKETDTIFTNVVTDKFNNPYKDIKLKVSSDNDKGLSMSSPTTYIDNKYNFLYAIVKNGKSASPEYWLIDMFLKQFKYPRKKYEIELNKAYIPMGTLMTNDGSNYIITDMEWDVISAQQNLNLVEWK